VACLSLDEADAESTGPRELSTFSWCGAAPYTVAYVFADGVGQALVLHGALFAHSFRLRRSLPVRWEPGITVVATVGAERVVHPGKGSEGREVDHQASMVSS
jgi:hypothetical protein